MKANRPKANFGEPEGLELLAETEALEQVMSEIAIKNFRQRHEGQAAQGKWREPNNF
jgi:hypothetical protein